MNAPFRTKTALPQWDLSELYASLDDPRIEADLARAGEQAQAFSDRAGTLVPLAGEPGPLGEALDALIGDYEALTDALGRVAGYAGLMAAANRLDARRVAFEADVRARIGQMAALTVWLGPEINRLSDETLEAAARAHAPLLRWRPWLDQVRARRGYELSDEMERFLAERSAIAAQWPRLFDETLAALKVGPEGRSLSEALNDLSDPRSSVRKASAGHLSKALADKAPVLALCLNTVIQEKALEDRWRGFSDPAASRHLDNHVDPEAVEAMVEAVRASAPAISHRYYRLKARAMGRSQLDHWDRNAPLTAKAPRSYDWDEGREIVLHSFARLGQPFEAIARSFFENGWIDAAPRPGKQAGAFAHPVVASSHPYIFMNWMGERRDVLTLAHELGHGVHQELARSQGTLLAQTPLTLAETASIFAEGLTFEHLLEHAPAAEQRGLLASRIEDGLNTVVRQIAFHSFEARVHAQRAEGEVSADALGRIWCEVMGESLGPAVRLNPGYEVYWAYVPHFVHTPFYVYAYAFGDLLVASLMERRAADPEGFAPLYGELLGAGGAKGYVEALAPFGLDPREPSFWATGLKRLERLVDAFEAQVGG